MTWRLVWDLYIWAQRSEDCVSPVLIKWLNGGVQLACSYHDSGLLET